MYKKLKIIKKKEQAPKEWKNKKFIHKNVLSEFMCLLLAVAGRAKILTRSKKE